MMAKFTQPERVGHQIPAPKAAFFPPSHVTCVCVRGSWARYCSEPQTEPLRQGPICTTTQAHTEAHIIGDLGPQVSGGRVQAWKEGGRGGGGRMPHIGAFSRTVGRLPLP